MSAPYARSKAALHIGHAIQRERELFDISAATLAERLELSASTIMGWEAGRRCPPIHQLLRIAWALGIPMTRLVEDVE